MWCIGKLAAEYRRRMCELLELFARPYDPHEPVICLDEKSNQLLRETRTPLLAKPGGVLLRQDYEYQRAGTCNIFVAVEPRGNHRHTQVTERRTKADFVGFVCRMAEATQRRSMWHRVDLPPPRRGSEAAPSLRFVINMSRN